MKNPEILSLLYLSVGTSWQPIWKLTLCIFSRDAHIIWIHSMTSRNKKFTRQKKPGEFTAGSLIIFTQFARIRLLRSPSFSTEGHLRSTNPCQLPTPQILILRWIVVKYRRPADCFREELQNTFAFKSFLHNSVESRKKKTWSLTFHMKYCLFTRDPYHGLIFLSPHIAV